MKTLSFELLKRLRSEGSGVRRLDAALRDEKLQQVLSERDLDLVGGGDVGPDYLDEF